MRRSEHEGDRLTDEELALAIENACPDCGALLLNGPRGGLSINRYCSNAGCGSRFNFLGPRAELGVERISEPGPLRFAAGPFRAVAGFFRAVTIHVLYDGLPLCRFSLRELSHWPAGHISISPAQYEANAEACNDPTHELHAVLPYEMCAPCGRAMVDPTLDAHVIPTEGRTCPYCKAPLVPNAPAVYCCNECAFADAGGPS